MTVLEVPSPDRYPWPSLGAEVCDWMESHLVFGPGDLRGEPYRLDDEWRRLIWRAYEVHPHGSPNQGRRRFRRVAISKRKGTAKTEFLAAIAAAELAPDGPVRCAGWRKEGRVWVPVGGPVKDPYIPLLAYTGQQSEELAFAALLVMLGEGPFAGDYDIGLERIQRRGGDGKALALANAPDARDGARTTFEGFDETHRLHLPRQIQAHRTMLANLPKRLLADAWALETTTAPEPGQNSVAEQTMAYARQVASGAKRDARLFFFHRQASEGHDLRTRDGIRAAVVEASGPTVEWSDIDGIAEQWEDPTADPSYLARVWLNMVVKASASAFDAERWKGLAPKVALPDDFVIGDRKALLDVIREAQSPQDGAVIVFGFDGSKSGDTTALVACEVATAKLWDVRIWHPSDHGGQIPEAEVDVAVDDLFRKYTVVRGYCDPPYWKDAIARWQGRYGSNVVLRWETWRNRAMGFAVRNFNSAIESGLIKNLGSAVLSDHIGAARRHEVNEVDDKGERLWTITKERPDSPFAIDGATASILAWEARLDAVAAGWGDGGVEWKIV